MKTEQEMNGEYLELICNNRQESKVSAQKMQEYLNHSQLFFDNRCFSKLLSVPKVYTKETIAHFSDIVRTTYGICQKVIREYLNCADYRKLFPFPPDLEELILVPNLYNSLLPIARFDIFYHEDTRDFTFCEINTDGTSAMNEDRVTGEAYLLNHAHQQMLKTTPMRQFELFDRWVDTFLNLYQTYEKAKPQTLTKPNVAIVDFLDRATVREFEEFARRFQKKGLLCEICDITALSYKNGALYSESGMRIDAIYRRAVTSDIWANRQKVQPFLQAVRDQNVFLAGSFATQIIHNKYFFSVLFSDRTKQILTKKENEFVKEHFPQTERLTVKTIDVVRKDKDGFIVKPMDSYACAGVFAGVNLSQKEWEETLQNCFKKDYICQRYCAQYRTKNIDFLNGDGTVKDYINMAGLYVYDGKFAGVFSRFSDGNIIASHQNERMAPTFYLC